VFQTYIREYVPFLGQFLLFLLQEDILQPEVNYNYYAMQLIAKLTSRASETRSWPSAYPGSSPCLDSFRES